MCPAPTELLWIGYLTESTRTPKSKSSVSNPKNHLADILTKGSFTRDEWHNLLHLFNIMNDTTFSCSHFHSHSFLSAGKQSKMSKRCQESSSLGSPIMKAKACCLVSRHCVSVGQDYSSNPKSPGSTRDSQVSPWEGRHEKSGWYSVQHASGNREYTRKSFKTSKINSDTIESISDAIYGFIDTGSVAHGPELRNEVELFKNSEFENIKGLFGLTRMIIEGNSEIKNVFLADVASSFKGKT